MDSVKRTCVITGELIVDRGGNTGDISGRGQARPRKQWERTVGISGETADGEAPEPSMLDQLDLNSTGSGQRVGGLTLDIVTILT